MRPRLLTSTLAAGLLGLLATARTGWAAGHGPGPRCAHGCTQGYACPHEHGHSHPWLFGGNPCTQFLRYDCMPLPPIGFSRYAEEYGDYNCTRTVFGDACPHFPNYWYGYRQPYPLPHSAIRDNPMFGGARGGGGGTGAASGR